MPEAEAKLESKQPNEAEESVRGRADERSGADGRQGAADDSKI